MAEKVVAVKGALARSRALNAAGCETSYVTIETDKGHDAFFLDEPVFHGALRGFLESAAAARGLA